MKLVRVRTSAGVERGEIVDDEPAPDGSAPDPDRASSGADRAGPYDGLRVETDDGTYTVGSDARLLAPCDPSALFCVGRNYAATLDQMDYDRPDEPDWFIKPPASVHAPGADVRHPPWTDELTYAGELAAVIDERCARLAPGEVPSVLRGYTVMNDLDALDQPGRTARKAFDGSGPLGPWIETEVDPAGVEMTTHVGDEQRQSASTDQMLFEPREVVAFLSQRYTFRPGDVVAFGSPANPGLVVPGERVTCHYEGVGTLVNRVVAPNGDTDDGP